MKYKGILICHNNIGFFQGSFSAVVFGLFIKRPYINYELKDSRHLKDSRE